MNQQSQPTSTLPRRPFDAMWWARRGVIVLVLLVLVDFTAEATLATMRRRDITLQLAISDPASTATATPNAQTAGTPQPSATPLPPVLTLKPTDRLIINVTWNYHIGPRFPITVIHAQAAIDNRGVADGQVTINCGAAVIDCTGQSQIQLAYTIPATGSGTTDQTIDWPAGNYTVNVDRSDGTLKAIPFALYQFQVTGP